MGSMQSTGGHILRPDKNDLANPIGSWAQSTTVSQTVGS
jgi:hypothetical protein